MAAPLGVRQIESLPVLAYRELRPKLKSGDLLFTSGDYLASQLIRKFTESPWSHVGIVFRVDAIDRVLLLESVEDMGVRFAPLSKYLSDYEGGKPYRGRIVVARCRRLDRKSLAAAEARPGLHLLGAGPRVLRARRPRLRLRLPRLHQPGEHLAR